MAMTTTHPEVNKLAQELGQYTGETPTVALLNALRERLERERRKQNHQTTLANQLLRIGRECSALPVLDSRSAEEILGYDQLGVPI
jgi:antitoxin VapB